MPTMRVDLYSMVNGYGFCTSESDGRVFFRVEDFLRLDPNGPLPITGERVEVPSVIEGKRTPRATVAQRLDKPVRLQGIVRSFDSHKGWGFVDYGSTTYFLHRSDMAEPFIPRIGSRVDFYVGTKRGRPRACHVTPLEG